MSTACIIMLILFLVNVVLSGLNFYFHHNTVATFNAIVGVACGCMVLYLS